MGKFGYGVNESNSFCEGRLIWGKKNGLNIRTLYLLFLVRIDYNRDDERNYL